MHSLNVSLSNQYLEVTFYRSVWVERHSVVDDTPDIVEVMSYTTFKLLELLKLLYK